MALNLTNISTQNNQKCPTIIKETFILFYSLSNIATTFFIVPILPIILNEKVSWYSIGFFFCRSSGIQNCSCPPGLSQFCYPESSTKA